MKISSKNNVAGHIPYIIGHNLTNLLFFFIVLVGVSLMISSLGTAITLGMPRKLGQEHLDIRMGMCNPMALVNVGSTQLPLVLVQSLTVTRVMRYVFHSDLFFLIC